MALYELDAVAPRCAPNSWVADSAQLIGDVCLEPDSSVWFGAVIRGDMASIRIGRGSNVQESCVLHADAGLPLSVGEDVTVGHRVMLHGCTIGDGSLIGIGSIILNRARIGRHCLVGAGSLITEGKEFADGSLIMGSPAKVVRSLTPEQIESLLSSARHYVSNAQRFRQGLVRLPDPWLPALAAH